MADYQIKQEDIELVREQGMNVKYGKDEITTQRYYRYHDEIQALMGYPNVATLG